MDWNLLFISPKLDRLDYLLRLRSSIGEWSFVRALKNAGCSFELAYFLTFGRAPIRR